VPEGKLALDRLARNTPSKWKVGGQGIFAIFMLYFLASLAVVIVVAIGWFLYRPNSGRAMLYKLEKFLDEQSGQEEEARLFAFSFDKFRQDLKVLGRDEQSLRRAVNALSREERIPPELVWAVIAVESGFDEQAVSPAGAQGLMQLMPGTAEDLDVENPLDPYQNVRGGIRYLGYVLRRFSNDYRLALAAYNAGPGAVEKYGTVPPYPETVKYVERVLNRFSQEMEQSKLHLGSE
jgi:soluble lytic murein transglycosylase-like protein